MQLVSKDVDLIGTVIKVFDANICADVLRMFQDNMADKKVNVCWLVGLSKTRSKLRIH